MKEAITIAAIAYLLVGIWLARNTRSRGFRADTIFVVTWGLHFIHETFFWREK